MKKIDLSEVFQMLDDENLEMPIDEQQKSDINPEKILKMTMERVHQEEKKQKTIYFMKNLKRFAACVAVAAILGTGVFVAANEENITRNIEGILGLPEEKVEKQEKTIEGKHFKVTVADSAFDGNIGWLSFRVHGISEEGKKSIANPDYTHLTDSFRKIFR